MYMQKVRKYRPETVCNVEMTYSQMHLQLNNKKGQSYMLKITNLNVHV
jgi:hypothetical protein